MKSTKFLVILVGLLAGVLFQQDLLAQSLAKPNDPYPKVGVITAGDLWDTFAPTWVRKTYYEQQDNPNQSWYLVRVGNLERQWTTPTQNIAGTDMHIPWKQAIEMIEYTPGINNFTSSTDRKSVV